MRVVVPSPPLAPTSRVQLTALATLSAGLAPGTFADALRPGLALRVAPVWGRLALPIELAVDAPGTLDDAAHRAHVTALPVQLGAALCPRFGARVVLSACGTLSLAAVVAWGSGYTPDATDVAFGLGLGGRVGVEVPLSGRWAFVASLDGRALLVRPALAVAGGAESPLWTAFPLTATLALGVAWTNR